MIFNKVTYSFPSVKPNSWSSLVAGVLFIFLLRTAAIPSENILRGEIHDVAGKPVSGAEVFIYNSPQVRRTADFISSPSDGKGKFYIVLPKGTYWAVARLRKKSEQWGPLMPGDRHSGDPVQIEVNQRESEVNFTIADLKEAAGLIKRKTREDYISIRGRIIDEKGDPVKSAYALANKAATFDEIPDYLSSWTDDEGSYVLYLPPGKYFLGSATDFPPGSHYAFWKEILFDNDASNVDIVITAH